MAPKTSLMVTLIFSSLAEQLSTLFSSDRNCNLDTNYFREEYAKL